MSARDEVGRLLDEHGTTYAEEAGVRLTDEPAPLFRLLVLTQLFSARISAPIAVAAARELFAAGWTTPQHLRDSSRSQRVAALGRAGYRRYDESTATALAALTVQVLEGHHGDLRRIRPGSHDERDGLLAAIRSFPRIGPTGARIFCREVQAVWPEVAPFFDERALASARTRGLPADPDELAALAPPGRVAALAAALVRADLEG